MVAGMMARHRTDHIVLHCSATRASQPVTAADIRKWHKARGWGDIGYHYVIRRDGTLEKGRHEAAVGAHVGGHNWHTLGICLAGGLNDRTGAPEDNFTPAQWETLRGLMKALAGRYPRATVLGHRDLSPDRDGDGEVEPHEWLKSCPCFDARAWAEREGFPAAPRSLKPSGGPK
jgi:N-acetyl-anhydromuramyl-L-alanine amidase AmpD